MSLPFSSLSSAPDWDKSVCTTATVTAIQLVASNSELRSTWTAAVFNLSCRLLQSLA